MSRVLNRDIEEIVESNLPFEQFRKKTFLITGATGLIGSLLVKVLLVCNQRKNLNLRVLAAVRNLDTAQKLLGADEALAYVAWDMNSGKAKIDSAVDYIIHTASITNSKQMVSYPVETIQTAVRGTAAVLELAREKCASMVYVSSMEVYGNPNLPRMVSEDDYGYIDLSNVRSSYPESKRLCECLCTAYASQYGVRVCTARLAQTFGAGILASENRVFAQFARSAMHGENIVLHTAGESDGNYVYTSDAVRALLILLVGGKSGQAYNVVNEKSHMTIAQMAQMVMECFGGGKIRVIFDIPEDAMKYGYAPPTKMHLCAKKIEQLGWHAQIGLEEAYRRMMEYMEETE